MDKQYENIKQVFEDAYEVKWNRFGFNMKFCTDVSLRIPDVRYNGIGCRCCLVKYLSVRNEVSSF
jgi:hypothetical protein